MRQKSESMWDLFADTSAFTRAVCNETKSCNICKRSVQSETFGLRQDDHMHKGHDDQSDHLTPSKIILGDEPIVFKLPQI